jgi:hypothetical protein
MVFPIVPVPYWHDKEPFVEFIACSWPWDRYGIRTLPFAGPAPAVNLTLTQHKEPTMPDETEVQTPDTPGAPEIPPGDATEAPAEAPGLPSAEDLDAVAAETPADVPADAPEPDDDDSDDDTEDEDGEEVPAA